MSKKAKQGRFERFGPLARRFLEEKMGEALKEYDAVKLWPEAAGPEIAKRCVALGIKSGILYICVPTHVWSTELSALKKTLMRKLNERLGRDVVKDIKCQVGRAKRKQ